VSETAVQAQADIEKSAKIRIVRIDAHVYRFPVEKPVVTSFGIMQDRPAVFVRVEDESGAFGWGEIWANWPVAGAEHRARLLVEDIADLVLGAQLEKPSDLFATLENQTRIRALQCGEWGPFRQVIAGLDIAAWDLFSRRAGLPVRKLMNANAADSVPAYASGIHKREAERLIPQAREKGFRAFKVKVGFDIEDDADRVIELAGALSKDERLFVDANQAWDCTQAVSFMERIDDTGAGWMEEPIPADAPAKDWQHVASNSAVPLAGGENLAGMEQFTDAIETGALKVIQPDIAKWGGFTGCRAVAEKAMAAGHTYCPHYLGGGIGLAASAHLLAAVGGEGLLEVDANPNPLRDQFGCTNAVADGLWRMGDEPGLGIDELPDTFEPMRTFSATR